MNVNIVNNYYKPGPATLTRSETIQQRIASVGIRTSDYTNHGTSSANQWDVMWHVWGKYYVDGNVNTKHDKVTNDNWTYGMYNQIGDNDGTYTKKTRDTIRIEKPIAFVYTTTHTADLAYEQVLAYAGASLHRDAIDELMVSDTRNGEGTYTGSGLAKGLINSQDDLKPAGAPADWSAWPELKQGVVPVDTDQDGMPDEWETANGLNPNSAADGKTYTLDSEKRWYTNLEVYLNSLVEDIMKAGNAEAENAVDEYYPVCKQPAGIDIASMTSTTVSTTYYNLQGQRIKQPQRGAYIIVEHKTDGTRVSRKVVNL
jgi:hypothetical protein